MVPQCSANSIRMKVAISCSWNHLHVTVHDRVFYARRTVEIQTTQLRCFQGNQRQSFPKCNPMRETLSGISSEINLINTTKAWMQDANAYVNVVRRWTEISIPTTNTQAGYSATSSLAAALSEQIYASWERADVEAKPTLGSVSIGWPVTCHFVR